MARNSIRVRMSELDGVGAVIDVALDAGANRVDAVQFNAASLDDARREALAGAIERARGDAEIMARAAGGTLGALIEVTTEWPETRFTRQYLGAFAATTISPAAQTVSVNVLTRWHLERQQ